MKKPLAILLIFLHILPSIPFAKQAQTIAVIEFEGLDISQVAAKALTNELESYLSNMGIYRVVERGQMENILQEQGLQQTGCISSECAVEVGQALGAQLLVSGSISKIGTIYSIAAKILDVETGEVIKSANYRYRGEDIGELLEGMADIATQLTGKSVKKAPSSIPQRPRTVQSTPVDKTRYGPEKGAVIFNINVSDAKLSIRTGGRNTTVKYSANERIGNTKPIELLTGQYRYEVNKAGYEKRSNWVKIEAGETKNIKIKLRSELPMFLPGDREALDFGLVTMFCSVIFLWLFFAIDKAIMDDA